MVLIFKIYSTADPAPDGDEPRGARAGVGVGAGGPGLGPAGADAGGSAQGCSVAGCCARCECGGGQVQDFHGGAGQVGVLEFYYLISESYFITSKWSFIIVFLGIEKKFKDH